MKKYYSLKTVLSVLALFLVFPRTNGQSLKVNRIHNKSVTDISDATIYPENSTGLNTEALETSGLFMWNDTLWTHNDNSDITFYAIDPDNGGILRTVKLNTLTAIDWEATQQDKNYLYLGDFGNNFTGIRTDLRIFKISKQSIADNNPQIDTIAFNYPEQEDYTNATSNTDFDCEAFISKGDSLYLFTKQWKSKGTDVYVLPKIAGNYEAEKIDTYATGVLVTDACYWEAFSCVVLTAYSKDLQPYMFVLQNFSDDKFFNGDITTLKMSINYHQVEGITTYDGIHWYASNEMFSYSIFEIKAQIHRFNLENYLDIPETISPSPEETVNLYPNPFNDKLYINTQTPEHKYAIYNTKGQLVLSGKLSGPENSISTAALSKGCYFFTLSENNFRSSIIFKQ